MPCKQTPCASGCQKTDCALTQWSAWTPCYVVGGDKCKGEQTRARDVATGAACGGKACDALSSVQKCDPKDCVAVPGYATVSTTKLGAVTNGNGQVVTVPTTKPASVVTTTIKRTSASTLAVSLCFLIVAAVVLII